jgi:hypothetical protein
LPHEPKQEEQPEKSFAERRKKLSDPAGTRVAFGGGGGGGGGGPGGPGGGFNLTPNQLMLAIIR